MIMHHTLLLRLVGPMQSWGVSSRFTVRDTGREPSKSGVVGLLAAALGRPREDRIDDLAALRMGVRVDREGEVMVDFHTASQVYKASGSGLKDTEVSRRYYLADAAFLVGLEGEDLDLLRRLQKALRDPVWPLYLGRKAFVPACPVELPDGLREHTGLEEALRTYPLITNRPSGSRLRLVLEDADGPIVRSDQPISFAERRFAPRRVRVDFLPSPEERTEC
ncbi:MAG: type I-E CRISPR-associated protein Cas5/CasD [Clostridiales bacterium]|nr:type I-E CRISPR-associated protein Cas5/CasD [Clostridiales bacterium]